MALVAISYEDAETAWKGLFFKFPNKISSCPVIGSYTRRAKETYTPGCQLATVKNKKKIKIKLTNEVSTRKKFAQVNKTDPNWASHLIKKKQGPSPLWILRCNEGWTTRRGTERGMGQRRRCRMLQVSSLSHGQNQFIFMYMQTFVVAAVGSAAADCE